jgi:hypothetical protein
MTHDNRLWDALIERAKAVRLEDELARRHHTKLTGRGPWRAGPCPCCGGTDRFVINVRRQTWFCRKCDHGGDIIELVRYLDGLDFKGAVELLAGDSVSRPVRRAPPPVDDGDEGNARKALAIWNRSKDPCGAVENYLARRGLELPGEAIGETIRFHQDLWFLGQTFPAMVGLVRAIHSDEPQAIHITSLIDPPKGEKRARYSYGPIGNGAIKLTSDANVTNCLGIGEGLETTVSLRSWDCFGASPIWCLISKGGVAKFPVLGGIETLWIATDHDPSGLQAAEKVSARWLQAGRETFKLKSKKCGDDLNDAALLRRAS